MNAIRTSKWKQLTLLVMAGLVAPATPADVVTDWNTRANDIVAAAKLPPHPSYRTMAMVQVAVYDAVNAVTEAYPAELGPRRIAPGASVEAAVAEANRVVLSKLVPAQLAAIDKVYQVALSSIPADRARTDGIEAGNRAAVDVLAARANDGAAAAEQYRPETTAGRYVPTVIPAAPQWPQRKPWVLASADQFRPGPPPSLTSERWARDFNEVKVLGAGNSTRRTEKQTEIARFWEATGPAIYFPVVRSVADVPGRKLARNARLLATAGVAMDDALTAVMDAKYHYHFWRPITAIRNGDNDGNAATQREPSWTPLVNTPMHPEYPCAHCILAGAVGAVVRAEVGNGRLPELATTSPTALGSARRWKKVDDFVQEVASARIYDGVHYRTSTEVGADMGRKIGELAAATFARQPDTQASR